MDTLHMHLEILGLSEPPPFADLILQDWKEKDQEEMDFVVETQTIDDTAIDLSKVIGTSHPDYVNYSWSKLLTDAKRIKSNLEEFQREPRRYIQEYCKGIEFNCFDNDHLFIGNGNHRTCLAAFYLYGQGTSMLHGAKLRKYQTDLKFKTAFRLLEAAIKNVNPRQYLSVMKTQTFSGYRVPGTFVVTNSLQAKLIIDGSEQYLDPQGMYNHIETLKQQKSLFKSILGWLS